MKRLPCYLYSPDDPKSSGELLVRIIVFLCLPLFVRGQGRDLFLGSQQNFKNFFTGGSNGCSRAKDSHSACIV